MITLACIDDVQSIYFNNTLFNFKFMNLYLRDLNRPICYLRI